MKAIIEVNVPDFQIGQEVSIYFKDTMMIKGIVQEPVLDKIRSEIEQKKVHEELGDVFKAHNVAIDGILQIIDKYRGDKNEANH